MTNTIERLTIAQVPREGGCTECPFKEPGPGCGICLLAARVPFAKCELAIVNHQRSGRKPEWCPLLAGRCIVELSN